MRSAMPSVRRTSPCHARAAAAWRARYAADAACDSEQARARLQRQHQHFEARQRQIAAVLGAHGVPVNFVHCERDSDYRVELS